MTPEQLFKENARLVGLIVSRWKRRYTKYTDHDDLRQEAHLALWEATQRFDATRGTKFEAYAMRAMWNRLITVQAHRFRKSRDDSTISRLTDLNCLASSKQDPLEILVARDAAREGEELLREVAANADSRLSEIVAGRLAGQEWQEIADHMDRPKGRVATIMGEAAIRILHFKRRNQDFIEKGREKLYA